MKRERGLEGREMNRVERERGVREHGVGESDNERGGKRGEKKAQGSKIRRERMEFERLQL